MRPGSELWGKVCSWAAWGLLAMVVVAAPPAHAQVDTGAVLGTVSDQSGAVIAGATVTLTNEGTKASLSIASGPDGGYKFTPVKIGTYSVSAAFKGFQKTESKGVVVNIGAQVVVDLAMKPGTVSETVEITAAAPLMQSQDASVGQVVNQRNVEDLPLNGRNFTFLAQLSAGVNTPQADTRGNAATGAFAANGLRPAQNNYLLDGIDNNSDTVDFLNGTNFVVLPPVDAIQEFKVQTSNFSAEFGRSGAAVLNATIKSGTNELHGSAWEFFRNDHLDAADFFENANNIKKGRLSLNQFGVTLGGPVVIPHVYNGKDKLFFFADYEGLRRVQGTVLTGTVPTLADRQSWDAAGSTINLQDFITGQSGTTTDILGRTVPKGTIYDPATSRLVTANQVDPVSGLVAQATGFARDPFGTCAASTVTFTMGACGLNVIPFGRLDPNAIKLLDLYPHPSTSATFGNFANSPKLFEHRNAFDARMDANINENNQMFFRFSYADDPQFIPGIFGGVADGGAFQQGPQTANAQQSALSYTHTFSPTLINEVRIGFNYLHTTRTSPVADQLGLPAQYGIQDIPQVSLNGGLPAFGISGLSTLGSNAFLPSDEVSSTFQLSENVTKVYNKHSFKMGFEWQHVKFSTLQPPWSHGEFDFNGQYVDPPNGNSGNIGIAQFLLAPTTATVPNGIDNVGGSSNVYVSNISLTDNGKNYYGGYAQDDWKVTSKLTLNLGVRYDYFGLVYEHHGNQANFVPSLYGTATYLLPGGANSNNLSSGCLGPLDPVTGKCPTSELGFVDLLKQDGINLAITDHYGKGLGYSQKLNVVPRIGFAYQAMPKLVVRGGFGMFYNGFENRGFSPNIGENYPFQFNFNFVPGLKTTSAGAFDPTQLYVFSGCNTAGPGGTATFETGFSCTPLSPLLVKASGLTLRGIEFFYKTPYALEGNFSLQYQLTQSMAVQAAYVTTQGRHLEVFPGTNDVSSITDNSTNQATLVAYPDFGRNNSYAATEGNSIYHALQTKVEKQFSHGLNFLFTYTWSHTTTDANDLLNGGSAFNGGPNNNNGYRAPGVPGFGIHQDYALAPADIRNVFHISGTYELPFGQGKRFASGATGWENHAIGGWSINWSATLQGGQPINIHCPSSTAAGLGCGALRVPGQPLKLGLHTDANGKLSYYGNPGAFAQPCILGPGGAPTSQPAGCVPLTGAAALGVVDQVPGPGFHRLDFSIFKNFNLTERYKLQFRTEIFNIFNHPNFNAPGFGGNGVVAISGSDNFTNSNFGEIGSTRDAPYDPRQIQFALKFLF